MKQVKAFLKPQRLDDVEAELRKIEGLPGLAITRVEGFGRGIEGRRSISEKIEIQVVVPDSLVPAVTEAIKNGAYTGQRGDGKIFIIQVDNAIRIRTGEEGESAL